MLNITNKGTHPKGQTDHAGHAVPPDATDSISESSECIIGSTQLIRMDMNSETNEAIWITPLLQLALEHICLDQYPY